MGKVRTRYENGGKDDNMFSGELGLEWQHFDGEEEG
jgi:hypothetical protein